MPRCAPVVLLLCTVAALPAASRAQGVWAPFVETGTIDILTLDDDGDARETPIWIVVVEGAGFIRTNDSTWLANIRRGSAVRLRTDEVELSVVAEEREDPAEYDRVEEAFKEKYGWMQRLMSTFRTTRPTVLRLTPATAG